MEARPPGVQPLLTSLDIKLSGDDLETFFNVAILMVNAVERYHLCFGFHGAINTSTVHLTQDKSHVYLDDPSLRSNVPLLFHAMAPEQRNIVLVGDAFEKPNFHTDFSLDRRTDMYGLGACFFEMLTKLTPFYEDPESLLASPQEHYTSHRLPSWGPQTMDIPQILKKIVLKLMAFSPSDRYSSLHNLRNDLAACQAQFRISQDTLMSFDITLDEANGAKYSLPAASQRCGNEVIAGEIRDCWERCALGAVEFISVSGPSGSGKSFLIDKCFEDRKVQDSSLVPDSKSEILNNKGLSDPLRLSFECVTSSSSLPALDEALANFLEFIANKIRGTVDNVMDHWLFQRIQADVLRDVHVNQALPIFIRVLDSLGSMNTSESDCVPLSESLVDSRVVPVRINEYSRVILQVVTDIFLCLMKYCGPLVVIVDNCDQAEESSLRVLLQVIDLISKSSSLKHGGLFTLFVFCEKSSDSVQLIHSELEGKLVSYVVQPFKESDIYCMVTDVLEYPDALPEACMWCRKITVDTILEGRIIHTTLMAEENALQLSNLVADLCVGSPRTAMQLLHTFESLHLLWYNPEHGHWMSDLRGIQNRNWKNVLQSILSQTIAKLPSSSLYVLRVADCIGQQVDMSILSSATNMPVDRLLPILAQAVIDDLMICDATGRYSFWSRGVMDTLLSEWDEKARSQAHLLIGHAICVRLIALSNSESGESTSIHSSIPIVPTNQPAIPARIEHITGRQIADDVAIAIALKRQGVTVLLFDAVEQLNRGQSEITDEELRKNVARLNLRLGLTMFRRMAYKRAFGLFCAGLRMVGITLEDIMEKRVVWPENSEDSALIQSLAVQASYSGMMTYKGYEAGKQLGFVLLESNLGSEHKKEVYRALAAMSCTFADMAAATRVSTEAVVSLFENYLPFRANPPNPFKTLMEISAVGTPFRTMFNELVCELRTKDLISDASNKWKAIPRVPMPQFESFADLLLSIHGPMFLTNIELLAVMHCFCVSESAKYGAVYTTPSSLSMMGFLATNGMFDGLLGEELSVAAINLADTYEYPEQQVFTRVYYSLSTCSWNHTLRSVFVITNDISQLTKIAYTQQHYRHRLLSFFFNAYFGVMRGTPVTEALSLVRPAYRVTNDSVVGTGRSFINPPALGLKVVEIFLVSIAGLRRSSDPVNPYPFEDDEFPGDRLETTVFTHPSYKSASFSLSLYYGLKAVHNWVFGRADEALLVMEKAPNPYQWSCFPTAYMNQAMHAIFLLARIRKEVGLVYKSLLGEDTQASESAVLIQSKLEKLTKLWSDCEASSSNLLFSSLLLWIRAESVGLIGLVDDCVRLAANSEEFRYLQAVIERVKQFGISSDDSVESEGRIVDDLRAAKMFDEALAAAGHCGFWLGEVLIVEAKARFLLWRGYQGDSPETILKKQRTKTNLNGQLSAAMSRTVSMWKSFDAALKVHVLREENWL